MHRMLVTCEWLLSEKKVKASERKKTITWLSVEIVGFV
jgi:hypothetical protein